MSARRFIRWMTLVFVAVFAVAVGVAFSQFTRTTPQMLTEARADMKRTIAASESSRQECVIALPSGEDSDACGSPIRPRDFKAEDFLYLPSFSLPKEGLSGALWTGVAAAALTFLIGATFVGAEWSNRTMTALFLWDSRRIRVVAAKAAVTAASALVVAAVAQLLWLGAAFMLATFRGNTVTQGFWSDLLTQDGRSVLLAVLTAMLGFGLANLSRNTGAALGIGFLYFAGVENAVREVWATGQQFLLTPNAMALLAKGGTTLVLPGFDVDASGHPISRELLLTNARGGAVLAAYCLVILSVGAWYVHRRDPQ